MRTYFIILCWLMHFIAWAANLPLNEIQFPAGFHISIYAANVPEARQMALAPDGTVFVGTKGDKVYALIPDNNNFTHASKVIIVADHLNAPNGVAFHNNALYVAETNEIIKYPDILQHLNNPAQPIFVASLPDKTWHGYRYIKFSPEGWLYVGIGAPCNVCLNKDPIFATIIRMQADGKNQQIFAKGVRNTVGFAWNPQTQDLWFTENGRDWLGDNLPPDELNKAPVAGLNFGFPYVYGDNVPDPQFGRYMPKGSHFAKPTWELPAHIAPLGMIFYTGTMFPEKYRNNVLIAEHGSWNRSKKIGYRISLVTIQNDQAVAYEPLITGFLQGQQEWGRPVDILQLPDGSILISDDYAGVIYRVYNLGSNGRVNT